MVPASHRALLFAAAGGFLAGVFSFAFFFYPPHASWDSGMKLGDVATWLGALATFLAVGSALFISGRDQRQRDLERRTSAALGDIKSCILLSPEFGNLKAVAISLTESLKPYEGKAGGIILGALDSPYIEFHRKRLDSLEAMRDTAGGVSGSQAKNILFTIAWSREMVVTTDQALIQFDNQITHITAAGVRGLLFSARILLHYVTLACQDIERILGDEMLVPAELLGDHPEEFTTVPPDQTA
jgi:hypothetical protein